MPAWNKIFLPKDELERLYTKEKLSIFQIAKLLNCSTGPVHRSLREYKISIRNLSEACTKIPVSKKQLRKWYFQDKLSMFEISNRLGCTHSAIVYKFQKVGIKSRGTLGLTKPINLTKGGFEYLYSKRRLSLKKIAKITHCSESGLERRFKNYNMVSRGNKNRACKYKKQDFSGNPIEKAYLIGFRLGDLNVKKIVSVIQVRCSTTIPAQVRLIRKLFAPYTTPHVWRAKRGTWEIVCLVNESFSFLLPKHKNIPSWILNKKEAYLNFLAGYVDAEGYFYFHKPKPNGKVSTAVFGIQTQDKETICQLAQQLNDFGIRAYGPRVSRLAGHVDKRGIKNNKDMWCFTVIQKQSLWKLIHYLNLYLKHDNKIKIMDKVRKNLILRNNVPYCRKIDLDTSFLAA